MISNELAEMASGDRDGEEEELLLDRPLDRHGYNYEGWELAVTRYHILDSGCRRRRIQGCEGQEAKCRYCEWDSALSLPSWPEMSFAENSLTISRSQPRVQINFNPLHALLKVDSNQADGTIKVAASEAWMSRPDGEEEIMSKIHKPFDWTFTTDYMGSYEGFRVEATEERIDLEALKVHEPILFFQEVPLFEDELADHGCSSLTLKLRCMPSGFFGLLRFYLRVDHVMVRIYDTRIQWRKGNSYLLREFVCREKRISEMEESEKAIANDPSALWNQLPIIRETYSKLHFDA